MGKHDWEWGCLTNVIDGGEEKKDKVESEVAKMKIKKTAEPPSFQLLLGSPITNERWRPIFLDDGWGVGGEGWD